MSAAILAQLPTVAAAWPRDAAGEFVVGGMALSRVVDSVGGTPCYLYDRNLIGQRVRSLRRALPDRVHLHYAIKANPMPALVAQMAQWVDGLDVASAGELRRALDSGMPAARISFAGPAKRLEELRRAHAAGVLVNVESARELRLLADLSDAAGHPARVAIRANLPFELKASGMKMSGGARPFGVDAERVPSLLAEIGVLGLAFEGFHLYAGSQNLRAEAIVEAQQRSFELALQWAAKAGSPLRSLNLGGGFGIPYHTGEAPLSMAPVLDNLAALAAELKREAPQAHMVIELGRYLVAEAGLYVCRVTERKVSRGQTFLMVDGGMHQHLAASGHFGQVVRKNYPVAVNRSAQGTEVASVCGPLCTPMDVLADKAPLAPAEEGDLVVVFQSGAYGKTASPRDFLGHSEPLEALV